MSFAYFKPETISEALQLLQREGYIPYAGGTDILLKLRSGKETVAGLVDIKNIIQMRKIELDTKGHLIIGAAATMTDIIGHAYIREKLMAVSQAAHIMGCKEIQNRATIGGNLANASPSAEIAISLLPFNAVLHVVSSEGKRVVSLTQFFVGPGKYIGGGLLVKGVREVMAKHVAEEAGDSHGQGRN